ncbi:phospholipase, patatin family [Leptospira fainei serovar Hurstbridge str. BUT 6]|uniref:Phospholipase, patatin family n=1 Tax=Leptospira fainei serovar Hurstbridge str. BUT 6 TaxID=1193011 RepID=S3VG19_9LEPT|nr:patatin-like phospholipase family protein [Leptospira fainei]EPG75425.1 phospholipase, patatin family [Leptospira fainei serovar Hurstbridge str. BUT 6]
MIRFVPPEALQFLASIPLFKSLPRKFLVQIYKHIEERNIYNHDVIYYKGEISKELYLIRHGEVMVTLGEAGQTVRYLGEGDIFAENSVLTRSVHSGSATAVLDTLLYVLDGEYFLRLAAKEKILSQNLMRLMGIRMREVIEGVIKNPSVPRRLICHIPTEEIEDFKHHLDSIVETGRRSHEGNVSLFKIDTFKDKSLSDMIRMISQLRKKSPVLHIYFRTPSIMPEFDKVVQQCDQIVFWEDNPERNVKQKTEIIDYWKPRIRNYDGRTSKIVVSDKAIHHEDKSTNQRIFYKGETFARYLVSKTRGLALGGGGARALAHVGLLKVLEREGIRFDYVSGSSFGAVIAALYARGESADSIYKMISKFFGGIDKPFDPTIPLISFFKGKKMLRMLKDAFGSQLIEDLKIPFVTSAVDLHSGQEYVMDQGPIWEALASAMSLPGMFPPVFKGDHLLIDGGVINNVPDNLIRKRGADVILSVNVSPLRDDAIVRLLEDRKVTGKSFFKNLWEDVTYPPILKIMARAITLEGREITKLRKEKMDLFVNMHIEEFAFTDFGRYKEVIKKGELEAEAATKEIRELFFPSERKK